MIPRDEKYLAFIREQDCGACGNAGPCDPHHVETGGTAIKGSDFSSIPLCRDCHMFLHDNGRAKAELMLNFSVSMCIAQSLHVFISGEKMKFPNDMMRRLFVN